MVICEEAVKVTMLLLINDENLPLLPNIPHPSYIHCQTVIKYTAKLYIAIYIGFYIVCTIYMHYCTNNFILVLLYTVYIILHVNTLISNNIYTVNMHNNNKTIF